MKAATVRVSERTSPEPTTMPPGEPTLQAAASTAAATETTATATPSRAGRGREGGAGRSGANIRPLSRAKITVRVLMVASPTSVRARRGQAAGPKVPRGRATSGTQSCVGHAEMPRSSPPLPKGREPGLSRLTPG
ncbi:hypothetical protein GCM10009721_20390 [Terrabacter tumescens]|uniref:Uncharacterized protein n=1 Tax=Terrabacter tumescens TaxID=60443 RepID=A0ABQ2I0C0_9MICO|nr:hypothetical protein GCM10009721_20390 [Terrabacter tumescens]